MIKVYSEFGPVVLETKDKEEYEKLVKFLESENIEVSLHTPGNDKRKKYYRIVFSYKYDQFHVTDLLRKFKGLNEIYE